MAMQRQDPGRDGGPPGRQRKRRSLRDCDVYMRTGVCVLGMTCLFNHPPERQQLQVIQPKLTVGRDAVGMDEDLNELFQKKFQDYFQGYLAGFQGTLTYLTDNLSAGDVYSHNTRPSSSVNDFSRVDFAQRGDCSRLDPSSEPESVIEALLPGNKVSMEQEDLATPSNPSAYFSVEDIHSHDVGPCILDPSSSSSAIYFSAAGVVQRGDCSKLDSSSELENVIEDSKVHWSELSLSNDSDGTRDSNCENFDNVANGNGESNREIFESLRQQPKYKRWLNCDVAPGDISLGLKIAKGGQAEIFEVEVCSRSVGFAGDFSRPLGSVLKVFKKGYSLQDLKSQWPDGLLFGGQFSLLFQGSMVLEDDRFALLLSRSDMDLRKLIDVTLDKYSPLFDRSGRPRLKELIAYKSKCVRSECSTPVFSEQCAKGITYLIAQEMKYLHSVDILHRDLKASNILCTGLGFKDLSICVADYESSIGVVGTRFWRAPEILKQLKERKSKIHFTREADVYGFAMTCYEIWTGHIPFEEYEPYDYEHVLNGARPTLPPHVPSWVKDLIQRCWHQNPSERPSFSAIVEELDSRTIFEGVQFAEGYHEIVMTYIRRSVVLERASDLV